jgi:hypothetical protein
VDARKVAHDKASVLKLPLNVLLSAHVVEKANIWCSCSVCFLFILCQCPLMVLTGGLVSLNEP